ncbi:MAG: hypothetical protein OEY89_06760 [Gammaproteobacteria bacterium]|nr:hypothetical protein [Gammaproteobacteria bacterium]
MSKRDFTLKEKFSALMQAGFYSVLLSNGTFIQYAHAAPITGKVATDLRT